MSISVKFRALTTRRAQNLYAEVNPLVVRQMKIWAVRVVKEVRPYPALEMVPIFTGRHKVVGTKMVLETKGKEQVQGYKRTKTLYRGWEIDGPRYTASGLVIIIKNNVRYAQWVQGTKQTRDHRARGWKRIDDPKILDRDGFRAKLQRIFDQAVAGGR